MVPGPLQGAASSVSHFQGCVKAPGHWGAWDLGKGVGVSWGILFSLVENLLCSSRACIFNRGDIVFEGVKIAFLGGIKKPLAIKTVCGLLKLNPNGKIIALST